MISLVIAVLSCKKNRRLRTAARKTWLVDCPYKYYFFIGGEAAKDALSDEIYLACPDTYEALAAKTAAAFRFIERSEKIYDYVFKCDDDTFVNWNLLPTVLKNKNDYAGSPMNVIDRKYFYNKVGLEFRKPLLNHYQTPYAAGMGYLLSRTAVRKIIAVAPQQWDGAMHLEDAFVGNTLYNQGIKLRGISEVRLSDKENLWRYFVKGARMADYLVIHHCSALEMGIINCRLMVILYAKYFSLAFLRFIFSRVIGQLKKPHVPAAVGALIERIN